MLIDYPLIHAGRSMICYRDWLVWLRHLLQGIWILFYRLRGGYEALQYRDKRFVVMDLQKIASLSHLCVLVSLTSLPSGYRGYVRA